MNSKFLPFVFLFITFFLQNTLQAQWRTVPMPEARIQSFGAASEDKLFLPGGLDNNFFGDVAVYDIATNTWSSMPLTEPRTMIEATIHGNLLFCAGGTQFGRDVNFSTIEVYDITTLEPLGIAELSGPRIGLSAVSVGDKVLFAGGASPQIDGPSLLSFEVYATVDIYDVVTDTWSVAELSDPRAGMAHAVLGDKVYFAGGDKGNGVVSDVVDIYDASTDTWSTDKLSSARAFYGGGIAFDNKVYFAGGTLESSENTTRIDIFEPSSNTWSTAELSTPRAGVRAGATSEHLLFASGASASDLQGWQIRTTSNVVDIYDLEKDEWSTFAMDNDRAHHMVLSAQEQVFIISGLDFTNGGLTIPDMEVFRSKIADFEAAVLDQSEDYELTIVGNNHIKEEVTVGYEVRNNGAMALENTVVSFEVRLDGTTIHQDSIIVNLAATDDSEQVSFSYLPEEVGFYEFITTASHENIGASFYENIKTLEVSENTLAKDDGIADSGFSFSFTPNPIDYGYFGTEYELLADEKITAVSTVVIPFEGFSVPDAQFNFIIKAIDASGNVQEGELYKSAPITASETFREDLSFYTYELTEPLDLGPGRYIFAFGQDSLGLMYSFGLDGNNADPKLWEYNPVESSEWILRQEPFTLMIRPHFGNFMTTSTEEQWIKDIPLQVFPNPTNDQLFIALDYEQERTTRLQLFDVTGKQRIDKVVNHHQLIQQDISGLAEGMYFLTLTSGPYQRSIKIIKQ